MPKSPARTEQKVEPTLGCIAGAHTAKDGLGLLDKELFVVHPMRLLMCNSLKDTEGYALYFGALGKLCDDDMCYKSF